MISKLSPKKLGQAMGVSESTIKRWIDEGAIQATKTPGGHRRVSVLDALAFIRDGGYSIENPELLGLEQVNALGGQIDAMLQGGASLVSALREGNAGQVQGLITSMYLDGRSIVQICDGPILNSLNELNVREHDGPTGIFMERRAIELVIAALYQVKNLLKTVPQSAPMAVGAGVEGDPDFLRSMMTSITLASQEWRTLNLGSNLPLDTLYVASEHLNARLVWLSFSVQQEAAFFEKTRPLGKFADRLAQCGRTLIIGGQGVPANLANQFDLSENIWQAGSMKRLAQLAQRLM